MASMLPAYGIIIIGECINHAVKFCVLDSGWGVCADWWGTSVSAKVHLLQTVNHQGLCCRGSHLFKSTRTVTSGTHKANQHVWQGGQIDEDILMMLEENKCKTLVLASKSKSLSKDQKLSFQWELRWKTRWLKSLLVSKGLNGKRRLQVASWKSRRQMGNEEHWCPKQQWGLSSSPTTADWKLIAKRLQKTNKTNEERTIGELHRHIQQLRRWWQFRHMTDLPLTD